MRKGNGNKKIGQQLVWFLVSSVIYETVITCNNAIAVALAECGVKWLKKKNNNNTHNMEEQKTRWMVLNAISRTEPLPLCFAWLKTQVHFYTNDFIPHS